MTPPSPADISVVFQGPVFRHGDARAGLNLTAHCLASVRHALPGAEVILSTWAGSDTTGLDFDKLVLSPDPGTCDYPLPAAQNCNRQLVSTQAGLKAATRPYAIKLRTDTIIEFPSFLDYLPRQTERGSGAKLFEQKIVASSAGTANFRTTRLFFSLSDLYFFGLTSDLITQFDVPLVTRPAGATPHSAPFVSEQWIAVHSMRKAGLDVQLEGAWPGSYRRYFRKYALTWERFLFANYKLVHPSHAGLLLTRRLYVLEIGYFWTQVDRLYGVHCEKQRLPWKDRRELAYSYLFPPR